MTIRRAPLPEPQGEDNVCLRRAPLVAELTCPGLATVKIEKGRHITYLPLGDLERVRALLLGPAVALLLEQRGAQVFHAGAVRYRGKALLLAGEAGSGKSTSVAGLSGLGLPCISDDLAALWHGSILSGYPFLRLWPESLRLLNRDPADYPEVFPGYRKRLVGIENDVGDGVPLGLVLFLTVGHSLRISRLSPSDALAQLVTHSFNARWGKSGFPPEAAARNFTRCSELVRHIPMYRLSRPPQVAPEQLADFVLESLAAEVPLSHSGNVTQ